MSSKNCICLAIGSSYEYEAQKLIKHGLRPCLIRFCIQYWSGNLGWL